MKYTLLQMTQNILSSMDGEEVNSISDTVESRQVAQVIRTSYFNILSRSNLPEHNASFTLDSSGDADQPVLMLVPDNISRIDWIKYNTIEDGETADNFKYVTVYSLQQFLDYVHDFDPDESEVSEMTLNDFTFFYRNDGAPKFCTIIRDAYVVFDSYDSAVDTTLQSSKTMCFGLKIPTFELSDSFVPDLDDMQFPLLLNEAKSLAFLEMKQIAHDQAIRDSRRQWSSLQKTKGVSQLSAFDKLPYFGRK